MPTKNGQIDPAANAWAAQDDSGQPNLASVSSGPINAKIRGISGVIEGIPAENPIALVASDSPWGN
jgi:hypothetical protein